MRGQEDFPDHYATLDIPVTADREQIREAYKRAAFANHPDRAINDQDRRERTARFQKVNEAHYVLSNDQRRKEYDASRRNHTPPPRSNYRTSDADAQFADIFEEAFRNDPEATGIPMRHGWMYQITGSAAGAVLGFIIANIPGAIGGFVAGNRLGAIRDNHGKSVYEVFQGLDPETRNGIIAKLAQKILTQTFTI